MSTVRLKVSMILGKGIFLPRGTVIELENIPCALRKQRYLELLDEEQQHFGGESGTPPYSERGDAASDT